MVKKKDQNSGFRSAYLGDKIGLPCEGNRGSLPWGFRDVRNFRDPLV